MTRAKTTLFKDKEGQRVFLENPIKDRLSTPLFLPPHPLRSKYRTLWQGRVYYHTEMHCMSSHPPTRSLVDCRSLTRSCTCDNGEGSLTMQPPPTLHMGLHLTHEWHVASPQKRPLCTLSRHLFFLRKSE